MVLANRSFRKTAQAVAVRLLASLYHACAAIAKEVIAMAQKRETVTFTFNGKRYFCTGPTKKDAAAKAQKRRAELEAGLVAASKKTVNQWFAEYMDTYKANVGDRTAVTYRSLYKTSIAPYIGAQPLKNVKSADLQRIMNRLTDVSLSHAKKVRLLLMGIFKTAVDNDLIPKSPYRNISMPDLESGERRALTKRERELFLAAASQLGDKGLFFLVIYHCGLRPSEVSRIREEDIDRRAMTLHVRGTKTRASNRLVPIPSVLHIPQREGFIFTTTRGVEPRETARREWWKKVATKMEEISGAPIADDLTPYCLRHDYCTRLQEAGVPIDIARRFMGHSSIEVTSRIYTHESDEALEQGRALIEQKYNTNYNTLQTKTDQTRHFRSPQLRRVK